MPGLLSGSHRGPELRELGSHERQARVFGRAKRVFPYQAALDIGALGSVTDPPADAGNAVIHGAPRDGMTFIANS